MQDIITLDYGSGGLKTAQLIDEILVPAFANTALSQLGDGAVLPALDGPPVFSTDSFVVSPWRFPGGDIGKLAVCGTVNDLCMAGGVPHYLSFSLILEEGFALDDLRAFDVFRIFPYLENVLRAGVELAPLLVPGGRHEAARVKRELFAVRGHFEHIVDMAVHPTAVDPVRAVGDLFRKLDDGIRRFQIDDVPFR